MNILCNDRVYIAIDLKSFYASVECIERGLNPMTTNLVVADSERTQKTICLAVSPSLREFGISGRARLFEVVEKVRQINAERKNMLRRVADKNFFSGKSYDKDELILNPHMELDYIVAKPRMAHYIDFSTRIFEIYLKYVAPEDVHIYSIDEVFIDATSYLNLYGNTPRELASNIIEDVVRNTGITATVGIGSNLYLAKIAMDIVAKHMEPDKDGVRIAELDEISYRERLWGHRPITDFWRVGKGYAAKLAKNGLYTMGDVAKCSLGGKKDFHNEELLYKLFGVNAELLIDHAWGIETCTISDIKKYKSGSNSMGSGQVLKTPYTFDKAEAVVREMAEMLALNLFDKGMVTNQIVLDIGYDIENLQDKNISDVYDGEIEIDRYGRKVPEPDHGSINLGEYTAAYSKITTKAKELFSKTANRKLLIRRIHITANNVIEPEIGEESSETVQMDMFDAMNSHVGVECGRNKDTEKDNYDDDIKIQETLLSIKNRFGKNAILKASNLEEDAITLDKNSKIGGHRA